LRLVRRFFNYLYFLVPARPPTVRPTIDDTGMLNIPDSMLLLARNGLRRLVPPGNLIRSATSGLDRAVERGEIFHLRFHLSNFAYHTDAQFRILDAILRHARGLRERGLLDVLPMGDLYRPAAQSHELFVSGESGSATAKPTSTTSPSATGPSGVSSVGSPPSTGAGTG
jgi:hypothetical protein